MGMEKTGTTYPILEAGQQVGELTVSPQGAYLCFRASCSPREPGLWRLSVLGGGQSVPLGVLAPGEGGCYTLERRFSRGEARRLGLEAVECGVLRRDEGVLWNACPDPGALFRDRQLRDCCGTIRGARFRREGEDTLLALPVNGPFPLMPLFCLAAYTELDGRPFLVFCLRDGEARLCQGLPG